MTESLWRRKISPLTIVYASSGIVYFGFVLEIISFLQGGNQFEAHSGSGYGSHWAYLRIASVLLTAIAPFPALVAFANVQSAAKEVTSLPTRILIWFVVVLGFLVSLAESMWTCGGHPTWLGGFPG